MRLIKLFMILPVLALLWGYSNSIGATKFLADQTGLPDASGWTIPGIDRIIGASETANNVRSKAEEKVRRAAIAALKKEVARRYGPEYSAAIPDDIPLNRVKRVTPADLTSIAALAKALDLPALTDLPTGGGKGDGKGDGKGSGGDDQNPGGGSGGKTSDVPFMNTKAYNKARDLLPTLTIKGKAPSTGYSREFFGAEWSDAAGDFPYTGNGCDTRNDILDRDLIKVVFEKGSDCEVASGVLPYDPYTGMKNRVFDAGDGEYSTDLDAEHTVALGNAYVTGAFKWDAAKRAAFANDPVVLQMVDPSQNRAKGDADAATWLPPNKPYRCAYVSRQIAIKVSYGLWVTPAEHDAMERVLASCPS